MNKKIIIPEEGQELTPAQKLHNQLMERLIKSESGTIRFETCSQAPAFGWSVSEYNIMPTVANLLRANDCIVSSAVNHSVTDWFITRNF